MTETRCGIHLCEWVGAERELDAHERAEHPTAVAAREGLARHRAMLAKDSASQGAEARGRGPSAEVAALPESPRRVHETPSAGRLSGQTGPRPRISAPLVLDEVCPDCDGAGVDPHYLMSCRRCRGAGSILVSRSA